MATVTAPSPQDPTIYQALLHYRISLHEQEEARIRNLGKKAGKRPANPSHGQEEGFAKELERVDAMLANGLIDQDRTASSPPPPPPPISAKQQSTPPAARYFAAIDTNVDDEPYMNPFTGRLVYPDPERYLGGPSRTQTERATPHPGPKTPVTKAVPPTTPNFSIPRKTVPDRVAKPQSNLSKPVSVTNRKPIPTRGPLLEDEGGSFDFPTPKRPSKPQSDTGKQRAPPPSHIPDTNHGTGGMWGMADSSYTWQPPSTSNNNNLSVNSNPFADSLEEDEMLDPALRFAPYAEPKPTNPQPTVGRSSTTKTPKPKTSPPKRQNTFAGPNTGEFNAPAPMAASTGISTAKSHPGPSRANTSSGNQEWGHFPNPGSVEQFFKDRALAESIQAEENRSRNQALEDIAALAKRLDAEDAKYMSEDRKMAMRLQAEFDREHERSIAHFQKLQREYQDTMEEQAQYDSGRRRNIPNRTQMKGAVRTHTRDPTRTPSRPHGRNPTLPTSPVSPTNPFRRGGITEATPGHNLPNARITEIFGEDGEDRPPDYNSVQAEPGALPTVRQQITETAVPGPSAGHAPGATTAVRAQAPPLSRSISAVSDTPRSRFERDRQEAIRRREAEAENKRKAKDLAKKLVAEDQRRREAEARKARKVACIICMEDVDKDWALYPCAHSYCQDCLILAFETAVKSKTPVACCGMSLEIARVGHIVPKKTREAYSALILELSTPNPVFCSNRSCAKFIFPSTFIGDIGTCVKCSTRTCRHCKNGEHTGLCKEDVETQRVLAQGKKAGWKQCTGCGHLCERISGCLHMTCPKCSAHFCYNCGGPYNICNGSNCPRSS